MKKVVTIGTFDGMHIGHKAVINTLRNEAATHSCSPMIVTFRNHPLSVIAPGRQPAALTSPEDKIKLLEKEKTELLIKDFTMELASLTASQWMNLLHNEFEVEEIVIGYDNTFGSDGRELTREDYVAIGERLGIKIVVAPEIEGVSSSTIRKTVAEGNLPLASSMLGRPYSISGEVIHGNRIGRTIGFPTANLQPDAPNPALPPFGVYLSEVVLPDKSILPGITNIGLRPTVNKDNDPQRPSIETHILDFTGDLYGRHIEVRLLRKIRDEKKFNSLEELQEQISLDRKEAVRSSRKVESPMH